MAALRRILVMLDELAGMGLPCDLLVVKPTNIAAGLPL